VRLLLDSGADIHTTFKNGSSASITWRSRARVESANQELANCFSIVLQKWIQNFWWQQIYKWRSIILFHSNICKNFRILVLTERMYRNIAAGVPNFISTT
jgi:hypothetical protein